ncbi:response regulator [Geopsychrobacter electrodiphilus]|uniref:response regulator n=1 Tax=Geopsychrobacter electrodiphilus TaxID=225196 RepID=UPI00035D9388|nr:response regulator [Geopsychrobacter electrodiphilus]
MIDGRILVVDNKVDRREHLVALLENQGISSIQASSCEEGLRILLHEPVSLILSETELPRKSGIYLLQETKKHYPDVEIILLTHNASSFTLLQALRHGAYDFIVRPIDTGEILFNTLERAFEYQRQKKEKESLLLELEVKNRQLNQTLHRLQSLNDAFRGLAACNDIQSIFTEMLRASINEVGSKTGFVALFDRSGENLGIKVSHNISKSICQTYAKQIPPGLSLVIARRGKPILVSEDLPEGLKALSSPEEREHLITCPGMLSIPLRIKERVAGVMIVSGHQKTAPFAEHDLLFMTQLATHAQLQLERIGLIHQLQREGKSTQRDQNVM